jgi:hypothetical protein
MTRYAVTNSMKARQMFGLSLDSWNAIYVWSLGIGAVAAGAVVIATFIVIKLQKLEAIDAAAEFAKYKLETEQKIAEANTRATEANARANEAELKLAEYRNPRAPIIQAHAAEFVDAIAPFKGTKFDMGHAPVAREQWDFAWQLEPLMAKAGWEFVEWSGGNNFPKLNWTMKPHLYGVANVTNVSIEFDERDGIELAKTSGARVTHIGIGQPSCSLYYSNRRGIDDRAPYIGSSIRQASRFAGWHLAEASAQLLVQKRTTRLRK